jgi:FkbM family methyltransferase
VLKLIYDFTISGLNSSLVFRRLTSKILLELIQKLSNIYDPLIQYKIDDRTLHLPMSHALPIVMNAHPYYSRNLARIASCIQDKYPDLTIIDIGANIGDSVFMLRNSVSCPILCIEGDPRFFEILRMNTTSFENVSIEQAFVGNDEGEINKQLVIVSGTAHFETSTNKTTKFRKLTSILADHPKFLKAKILKIDTDGFDLSIVRGAIDFIQTAKPIIFFEYDPYFHYLAP